METKEAIEIFRDHLTMKDGSEFIWKDYEDAALHILTITLDSELVRKERDILRDKFMELIRVIELAEGIIERSRAALIDAGYPRYKYNILECEQALSEIRKLRGVF